MAMVRIINGETAAGALTLTEAIEAVESAYSAYSTGRGALWPLVSYVFEDGKGDLDIKSGCLMDDGVYGLKLVSWFGGNQARNLPQLVGTTLLFDAATGLPLALLNADALTGLRTGAAGAIGAKYLARPESRTMLMVGAGNQSPYQIAAMLSVMKNISLVRLANPFDPSFAKAKAASINEKVHALLRTAGRERDFTLQPVTDLAAATGESDVITTATPSCKPMIMDGWVQPGTHFSCIGADMSGKEEIDARIFARARVFADDIEQAAAVGETEIPLRDGIIKKEDIVATIGGVIAGAAQGRLSEKDITVFDSTGLALQDLAVAKKALDAAEKLGLGTVCTL